MDPHTRLEFAKMMIRTKALKIMAKNHRANQRDMENINWDIDKNLQLLTRYVDNDSQETLLSVLEHRSWSSIL